MNIKITKHDGTKEAFNADQINRSIERACRGLTNPVGMVTQIATETKLTLYDGITTEEMDQATINAAIQNIREDIEYDVVAVRLLLKTLYRKVFGDYDKDNPNDLKQKHRDGFITYVKEGVANGRLHPNMEKKFDLEVLADVLVIERDELFNYAGLDGLMNRYGVKDLKQQPLETPQYLFMRIAMGLSYNEKSQTDWAKKFYDKMSKLQYIAGGSTNLAAGTARPALSNCFLLEVHDDMEHIAKSVADVILLSKASGGIGASVTKLRSSGSPLKSNFGGVSTGPTPFAKIMDTAIRAIQRGGKKKGALCFYMENWHLDFPEFIDWRHNAGDDYMRMRTADTAVFISDEFMKRVMQGEPWYMFDPVETKDLNELYGQAFSKRYQEYIKLAETGELRTFRKVPAVEQFRQILVALQSTSHPWLTWKDTINLRALNNNTGTIHMSNLCTEICLPQDRDNVAVCNLASLNLAAHISNKEVNWMRLEESIRLVIRQLDNLIDINQLPIPEAEKSDQENRAIGLGVMGLADAFEKLGLAYDSEHAWNFADRIFEFVSYMAIDESANLAKVRGSYKHFKGSLWSKGLVPIDTITHLEENRGRPLTVNKASQHRGLDWDILRTKVKQGMRNATLMAVAPNANIGLVAGTTPGMDPRFAQIFSRNKISGKYIDINHNLVKDLKNMGIWEEVRDQIIEHQGDISGIEGIPDHIKDIYKTSFTVSPYAFIEVAARVQKWVDQALSRNIYLETRDIDETMRIYQTAWEKGLKTTYYLHMKPRHTAEQSTVAVNKSQKMGKIGFAAVRKAPVTPVVAPQPFSAPLQKGLNIPVATAGDELFSMVSGFKSDKSLKTKSQVVMPKQKISPTPVVVTDFEKVAAPVTMKTTTVDWGVEGLSNPTPTSRGFQPISSLKAELEQRASVLSPKSAGAPVAVKNTELENQDASFVCPIDPAEREQCDSCQ